MLGYTKEIGKRRSLDKEIGKRLRMARKLRGYSSARKFAKIHEIPESTYSQYETGSRTINPVLILYFCQLLEIDPGWLLSGCKSEVGLECELEKMDAASFGAKEVSLNTSNRKTSSPYRSDAVMNDNLIAMDADLFKDSLKKGIQKYLELEISADKLEALIQFCKQRYDITKVTPGYQAQEGDSISSV